MSRGCPSVLTDEWRVALPLHTVDKNSRGFPSVLTDEQRVALPLHTVDKSGSSEEVEMEPGTTTHRTTADTGL